MLGFIILHMTFENNQNQTEKYITESKFEAVISDLKQSILDGFDKIFYVIDENNKQLRAEITTMVKSEISELRQEMNQRFYEVDLRFISIDKRFVRIENSLTKMDERIIKIENNMVYRHELDMV